MQTQAHVQLEKQLISAFEEERTQVLEEVQKLWAERGEEYDVVYGIWGRMPFGVSSLLDRTVESVDRVVQAVHKGEGKLSPEYAREKLLDAINYAVALIAFQALEVRLEGVEVTLQRQKV